MAYRKPLFVKVVVVMGTWDEDGELVGKEEIPQIVELCHPIGRNLDDHLRALERENRGNAAPFSETRR